MKNEMETKKCKCCGGIMYHSSDMEDPCDGGHPFFQCEQCGELVDDKRDADKGGRG